MFKTLSSLLFFGVTGLSWLASGAAAQEKVDKTDALVREATEQFMKAMKAEDLERVMKAVHVPFFWDGVKNIKDREDLKKHFADVFADKDLTQLEYKIKEVHTFAKARDTLREKDRELLKEILNDTDRIVHVVLQRDGVAVMVRIREGKAQVVGFRD